MATEPNDAAFARPDSDRSIPQTGLTKREYFAAMMAQGLVSNPTTENVTPELLATAAIAMADGLIAGLNKETNP